MSDDTPPGKCLLPCDERHYARFLRRVLPGPERTRGEWVCDVCGTYFDHDFRVIPPLEGKP